MVTRQQPLAIDTAGIRTADNLVLTAPLSVTPDSVTFTGPASIVDSFPVPFILPAPSKALTETYNGRIQINYKNKALVAANVEEAEVKINVAEVVQEERQLAPELINFPKDKGVLLRPPMLNVRYRFLKNESAQLNRDAFKLQLDYSKFNKSDSTIAPEVVQKPEGLRYISVTPEKVKISLQD
ncbi:MAG: hypothetical protein LPK19_02100 [Hymenobacteraceae bacterium]|nr:hypothetical protein [Hymenobacteraceae bacterium]MDX5394970.1 hypothetical protein [Hymenobacteraceae bacterium]MDX5511004.1 hypothetical protein [Hymenobacteraceae bacterium]